MPAATLDHECAYYERYIISLIIQVLVLSKTLLLNVLTSHSYCVAIASVELTPQHIPIIFIVATKLHMYTGENITHLLGLFLGCVSLLPHCLGMRASYLFVVIDIASF